MKTVSWEQTKSTLLDVLDVEPSKRNEYLVSLDLSPDLRSEIESLIAFDSGTEELFDRSALELAADLIADGDDTEYVEPGRSIGKYRVISELGFGGMGAVYLAERSDGEISQRVAIKLLRREFNAAKIREMFGREREIHSRLDHPNIARVIDAGSTDDDIPFLVMEYVEGSPIDAYCQENELDLIGTLKLFNKVCGAVAFAHRNLVIHRDLKPSNIIVTKDAEPKLLDFGISKLLDGETRSTGDTGFTALTPDYASPEQIGGRSVTTATDIYSLGAVLYRLLASKPPVGYDNGKNGTFSSRAGDGEIKAPSTILDGTFGRLTATQIRGDIDNIVLKALAKEPEQRYSTVEEFSADVWRYIDGLPVTARRASLTYRSMKFVRRNKLAVTAAGLIVVSLCAGIAVSLVQAERANAQALIAESKRDEAQRASKRAEKTSKFMQSFLDYANPNWYGRGKGRLDVTVMQAIDDAAGRIDIELADEPEIQADLHYTLGNVYSSQNQPEKTTQHFARSLELYRIAFGERHPRVARAIWYYAITKPRPGGVIPPETVAMVRDSVEMMRETDPDDINLPYMLQNLAQQIMGKASESKDPVVLAEVEQLLLEARPLFVRHYDEHHGATITISYGLTELALIRGDLAEAQRVAESAVQEYQQWHPDSSGQISALLNLARVQFASNKRTESEASIEAALVTARKFYTTPDDFRLKKVLAQIQRIREGK